jgi:predicted DNA-binding transcriptional regulator AlpA
MRAKELIDDPVQEDELAEAVLILAAQLLEKKASANGRPADRLLDLDDAAERLNVSSSWLYRRSSKLPFVVRNGRKLAFSERGIEDYIAGKKGKGQP